MFRYTAIEREYGSGGHAIAQELARACSLPLYGQEILEAASRALHVPEEQLEGYEERSTNSLLFSLAMLGKSASSDDMLMKDGKLFVAEQMAIRELAAKGPCIFLGHCASEALKDVPGVLRVFIRSSCAARKARIIGEYGIPEAEVRMTIQRYDRKRSAYYTANTSKTWNDPKNYDMVLDSSTLGIKGCAALLASMMKRP